MELVIAFGINVVTQFTKKYITPKYGATGVHCFIFGLGLIAAAIQIFVAHNSSYASIVREALAYLILSVSLYHILLNKLGFSSVK